MDSLKNTNVLDAERETYKELKGGTLTLSELKDKYLTDYHNETQEMTETNLKEISLNAYIDRYTYILTEKIFIFRISLLPTQAAAPK